MAIKKVKLPRSLILIGIAILFATEIAICSGSEQNFIKIEEGAAPRETSRGLEDAKAPVESSEPTAGEPGKIEKNGEQKAIEKPKSRAEELEEIKLSLKTTESTGGISDDVELDNILLMELESGVVVIEMLPDKAIGHVQRVSMLVREGFYDGLTFHRVIKGFMAQTGDPTGTGNGGSKFGKMYAEINDLKHIRGAVSMARASDINSADSQFFIITGDHFEHLDGQYTIWGKVLQGMELIDGLASSNNERNGLVDNPSKIIKMILMKDMNYNYEGDTEEQKENRRKSRIEILRNLREFKKIYDETEELKSANSSMLDRIIKLNGEIE
ncbi:MAG: peptidylprolyl isomerase [Rickettsiales bacterium]|nr:peptidylprolyl isomerase [Rickettsiales bacterium]